MSECLNTPLSFIPRVGSCQEKLTAFCEGLSKVSPGSEQSAAEAHELRKQACAFLDRPTIAELKLMLVSNVLLDLALHGWTITPKQSGLTAMPPDHEPASPLVQKDRIRQKHLIERDAQLREASVQEFIRGMERRRLTTKGWHSIYSVIRDGEELAAALRRVATYGDLEERDRQLTRIINPYLQFVTPDGLCPETGLRLNDIWRYFRHTWVNAYRSVPGRSLMVLVRDRATPYHPVIGIAALASSVIQQSIRDKWIGWDTETAIATILSNPTRKMVRCLLEQLRDLLKSIYIGDLVRDRFLNPVDLNTPSAKLIQKLRSEAEKRITMHRKNPEAVAHKTSKARCAADWVSLAETNLYRSKRCKRLAALLEIQQVLRKAKLTSLSTREFQRVLQQSSIKHALQRIVRFGKAQRAGISMMDIMVCGAIAPYNAILGGKLICLLLCSPEVVQAYAERYTDQVSVIASAMKGKKVRRDPALVLLCTTSLYGNGSSQYNRVKLPAEAVGGESSVSLKYEELGMSEGFGSFHFSKESLRIADALLGRSKQGRKVNSIFGEGVNPLMRKMREALSLVGLPSDELMRHGNKRIVYGVPLAKNFRSVLLGFDKRPRYIIPQDAPRTKTARIATYWRRRWLSRRIEDQLVLDQVALHSLAYPVHHGAQVQLPGIEAPPMLKSMNAAVGSGMVVKP